MDRKLTVVLISGCAASANLAQFDNSYFLYMPFEISADGSRILQPNAIEISQ